MSIRTNYEKWYEGEEYYWGLEPGDFLFELIKLCPPAENTKVLDIGCGEGKDAVFMAEKGYDVTAFDLTENFEDNSGGIPHYHCMDTIICRKSVNG